MQGAGEPPRPDPAEVVPVAGSAGVRAVLPRAGARRGAAQRRARARVHARADARASRVPATGRTPTSRCRRRGSSTAVRACAPRRWRRSWSGWTACCARCGGWRPDVIHAHVFEAGFPAVLLGAPPRLPGRGQRALHGVPARPRPRHRPAARAVLLPPRRPRVPGQRGPARAARGRRAARSLPRRPERRRHARSSIPGPRGWPMGRCGCSTSRRWTRRSATRT